VAVASAGPDASLHLAPDKLSRQHPTTQVLTGLMPLLPPNQQRQSTEGKAKNIKNRYNYSRAQNSMVLLSKERVDVSFTVLRTTSPGQDLARGRPGPSLIVGH